MKLEGLSGIGIVIVCGTLTPFIYSLIYAQVVIWGVIDSHSLFVYHVFCVGSHLLIVGFLSWLSLKIASITALHRAAFFTCSALISTRLQQFLMDQSGREDLIQVSGLLVACLIVYGVYLWNSKKKQQSVHPD